MGGMQNPFRKPKHSSLGSITLVRRSFISVRFSPPAANIFFARRQPHLGCIHLAAAIAHSSLISQSIAKVHLHSSATFVPCGKYTTVASYVAAIAFLRQAFLAAPLWGLAVRLHDVVPPYSGGHRTARHRFSPDKFAGQLRFFFAAGAFTGINTKKAIKLTALIKRNIWLIFIPQQHLHLAHLILQIQYHYPCLMMNHTFHLYQ